MIGTVDRPGAVPNGFDAPPIEYSTTAPVNPVSALQAEITAGRKTLNFDEPSIPAFASQRRAA